MIKRSVTIFFLFLSLFSSYRLVAEEQLVSGKDTMVSKKQFLDALQRMDEKTRDQFLNEEKRVLKAVKNFYITEVAVAKAKKSGLYNTPKMQALIEKAVNDAVLREMYEQYVDKAMAKKKFEGLAYDQYKANPEKYKTPSEINASHILLNYNKRSKDEAKELAEKIRKQLLDGADFIALAKKYSDDPSVEKNNGNLGFFSKKKMVKPFSEAAFALKQVGDISPLVETSFGFHIIRLDQPQRSSVIPFEKIKDKLVKDMKNKEISKLNQIFKAELLDSENIDINIEAIKSMVTH